jgi:hypothetical protein
MVFFPLDNRGKAKKQEEIMKKLVVVGSIALILTIVGFQQAKAFKTSCVPSLETAYINDLKGGLEDLRAKTYNCNEVRACFNDAYKQICAECTPSTKFKGTFKKLKAELKRECNKK